MWIRYSSAQAPATIHAKARLVPPSGAKACVTPTVVSLVEMSSRRTVLVESRLVREGETGRQIGR